MSLFRSTATVGGFTLVSRILGFARDVVLARAFGAGVGTDAFFVAFKIPNFLRRLFAEGAFSLAFVPVLSEYRTQREHQEVRRLISAVAGTLGSVLLLVSAVAMIGAPVLVMVFAPGFADDAAKFALTADLLRITFPYLLFISLTALAGGVLNSYDRFGVPAMTPIWLNICLIAAALWAAPLFEQPVEALAWGVFVAGVVQLAFQLPFLARLKLLMLPRPDRKDPGVRRIMKLMVPALFGSSVAQINLLLDTIIASFLVTGSVSWLYYSDRLVEFPLGVFGIALATVILPSLSKRHAEADPTAFAQTLDWALRWALLIGLPATVGLVLLAGPMLTTLFHYGEFSTHDVAMARLSLMAASLGLPAFILVKVLAPGFYARQDTKTPVKVGIIAMVANMGLNVAFVVPLVMIDYPGPHAGLALATAASSWLNGAMLLYLLHRRSIWRPEAGWLSFLLRALLANGAMAALLLWLAGPLPLWLDAPALERAARLGLLIGVAALLYFAMLWVLRMPLRELVRGRAGAR